MFYEAPTLDQAFATYYDYSYLTRKNTITLDPHYSKCGPRIHITRKLVRHSDSGPTPDLLNQKLLVRSSPDDTNAH